MPPRNPLVAGLCEAGWHVRATFPAPFGLAEADYRPSSGAKWCSGATSATVPPTANRQLTSLRFGRFACPCRAPISILSIVHLHSFQSLRLPTASHQRGIERAHDAEAVDAGRDVQVNLRCCNVFVAEDLLDRSEIGSAFEEMGGKTVTEGVAGHSFFNSGLCGSPFDRLIVHLSVEVMTTSDSALGID
jgi:hypothetical protein